MLGENRKGDMKESLRYNLPNTPCFLTLLQDDSPNPPQEETEENNFIEPEAPRTPQKPRPRPSKPEPPNLPAPAPTKPPTEDLHNNEVVNTQQMCKLPFNCLFWISFHVKIGGVGPVSGLGRAQKYRR